MKVLADVIIKPIITEKATDSIADKKYVFEVALHATKPEIAAAVEAMFDVQVAKVNTCVMKSKPKRMGVHMGKTSKWKKAIVTLAQDSKSIAFFDSMN